MKKNIFFILLMLLVCVFANAQTVSQQLKQANENYLFGTGAYELNGSDGPRPVNVSPNSPNIGDIETGETVKVLVTLDSPADEWEVLAEPTLAEISNSGPQSHYVFEIILVARNTLGNDTLTLVCDGGYIELPFNVVAPKKDFTVKGVCGHKFDINPEEYVNLNKLYGKQFALYVYDDQGEMIFDYDSILSPLPVTDGDIVVNKRDLTIAYQSGYGTAKVEIKKEGYNDFVFYVTYTKPMKGYFTVFGANVGDYFYINPEESVNLNKLFGKQFSLDVYDDQGEELSSDDYEPIQNPLPVIDGDIVVKWSGSGIVYQSGSGTAKVEIKKEGYNDFVFYVEYTKPEPTGIKMTPRNKTINGGETFTITASVLPAGADQTLTWKSSNPKVATVDQNGVVTGLNTGNSYIKATTSNGITVSCKVTVIVEFPDKLVLSNRNLDMCPGKTFTVKATVSPDGAKDKTITWKSSNPKVATVDQNGTITAVALGTTYIKATTSNGITVSCKVNVVEPVKATGIKMTPRNKTINVGETFTIKAVVLPELLTDDVITWKSSNSKVATVDQKGTVTGIQAGTSYVKATVNGITISCKVIVQ